MFLNEQLQILIDLFTKNIAEPKTFAITLSVNDWATFHEKLKELRYVFHSSFNDGEQEIILFFTDCKLAKL